MRFSESERSDLIERMWPVGAVYLSFVATDPSLLFGFGTWQAIATGRTLVGIDPTDTDFDAAGKLFGTKTHALALSEMPSHTHTQDPHTHTQNSHTHTQDPHTHTIPVGATDDTSAPFDRADAGTSASGANATASVGSTTATCQGTTAVNQNATATNQSTGGGAAHNNVQPSFVVYMWRRTE